MPDEQIDQRTAGELLASDDPADVRRALAALRSGAPATSGQPLLAVDVEEDPARAREWARQYRR